MMRDVRTESQDIEHADSATTRLSTVTEWIRRGVELDPDAPALSFGAEHLSYAELDALSNQIARHLVERGVVRGDRVGLCIDRSVELIACLVGVLKSGAAYVPLDPTYPKDRLAMMREDADLRFVLASDAHAGWIGGNGPDAAPVLPWEMVASHLDELATTPVDVSVQPDDDAYVIFTSGSTGRPKGIQMPHRALANLIDWQLERATFEAGARVLQYSSISFDVSFQEVATTLASGGELIMVRDSDRRDPRLLLKMLRELRVQRLFLPFVALRSLVEVAHQGDGLPRELTEIITAGEQLRVDDVMREVFGRSPALTLDNQYGPSESHVITAHLLEGDPSSWPDFPPIGRALTNCTAEVLDEDRHPVAQGAIGEIYLGGINLAHGYFRRPDLTERAFVQVGDGDSSQRLYRTGDLASVDEHGDIHYEGRIDDQVKIRGHRIEPGEINAVASRLDGVGQSLTHAFRRPNGAAYLVTYFTKTDDAVDAARVRQHLREHLPEYMVPAFVIELDRFELGPSGKADLRSMPDPRTSATLLQTPEYDSDTERRLAAIWNDVLDFPNIPADANFFDLGGDSLAAVTLFLRISEEFELDLPLAVLAQTPTIRALARRIDERGDTEGFRSLQLLQDGPDDVPPMFLVHGGGGNVLIYGEFAANLAPDQRLYAFQWSGWDGGRGERTIAEMAAAYKEELLRAVPEGPYRIGGHCIGGLIAIELAHQLVADGAEIDGPLIVSDAPNLAARSYHREDPDSAAASREQCDRRADEILSMVPAQLRTGDWRGSRDREPAPSEPPERSTLQSVLARLPWLVAVIRTVRDGIRIDLRVLLHREVPMRLRERYCTNTLIRAAKRHRSRTWNGDVLYLRAGTFEAKTMGLEGWWDDTTLGFEELCTGRFDLHVVGGYHNDPFSFTYSADLVREAFEITPRGD
jgi:amino acid adenylation domain-containing protein